MVLAAHGLLLSYSAQIRSQNEEKNPPPHVKAPVLLFNVRYHTGR
jgi:hypothetical protein